MKKDRKREKELLKGKEERRKNEWIDEHLKGKEKIRKKERKKERVRE